MPAPTLNSASLVLVVDDDPTVLDALTLVVEALGSEVVGANDPAVALARLRGRGRAPDAVLVDYRLGVETTGLDVMRSVREEWGAGIPAVLLTGDTSAATLQELAEDECFAVLTKPVTARKLESTLGALADLVSKG